jgi:hypothetical protein
MNRLEHLLLITGEECGEIRHRIDKALRFSLSETEPGQAFTNAQRIMHEYCDLIGVMEMLSKAGAVDFSEVSFARIRAKKDKVEKFLKLSAEMGTLQESPTQQEENADRAMAIEFAKERWDYTATNNPHRVEYYDHNKYWLDVSGISEQFQKVVDYLISVGCIERNAENPSQCRWLPTAEGESA